MTKRGQRIRGKDSKEAAEVALAKEKFTWASEEDTAAPSGPLLVARACSEYIQYCEQGHAKRTISKSHRDNSLRCLNDLCSFCGALPVARLKKGHISSANCILANIAAGLGRTLLWDEEKGQVKGDDQANRLLKRPYREPVFHPEPANV